MDEAEDGQQALLKAQQHFYDIIFLDIDMPVILKLFYNLGYGRI